MGEVALVACHDVGLAGHRARFRSLFCLYWAFLFHGQGWDEGSLRGMAGQGLGRRRGQGGQRRRHGQGTRLSDQLSLENVGEGTLNTVVDGGPARKRSEYSHIKLTQVVVWGLIAQKILGALIFDCKGSFCSLDTTVTVKQTLKIFWVLFHNLATHYPLAGAVMSKALTWTICSTWCLPESKYSLSCIYSFTFLYSVMFPQVCASQNISWGWTDCVNQKTCWNQYDNILGNRTLTRWLQNKTEIQFAKHTKAS